VALLGNGYLVIGPLPMTYVSGAASGLGYPGNNRAMFARGDRKNQYSAFTQKAGTPDGTEHPVCWIMPNKGGAMSAQTTVNQDNTIAANLQKGINMEATMTQDGSITAAALSMITSMTANMTNANTLTGGMQLTMNLAANMVQEGQIDAALGLIAWCSSNMAQTADMSASNLRGTLNMEASIVSYGELTPEGLRDAVWSAVLANYPVTGTAGNTLALAGSGGVDYTALANAVWTRAERTLSADGNADVAGAVAAYAIESGWTTETLLRVFAAVLAGKVSGAGTGTEVFRDINDTKDRVTATVDSNGNRTAITLDGS
jgi:hypothetical protein